MKKNATMHRYLCLLLFTLSSHSIFKGSFAEYSSESQSVNTEDDDDSSGFDFFSAPAVAEQVVFRQDRTTINRKNSAPRESIIKKILEATPRFTPSHYTEVIDPRLFSHRPRIDHDKLLTAYFQKNRLEKRIVQLVKGDDFQILESAAVIIIPTIIEGLVTGGGVSILTGPAAPIIGSVIAVGWLAKHINDKKKAKKNNDDNSGGGGPKKPEKDPKKDPKLPKRIYKNNPKHHKNSRDGIGKPPKNGQKTLDKALDVPEETFKVGIEDGKIVVFKQHSPNEYHGYIEENFHNLDSAAQKALSKAGLVNPKSGRVK